MSYHMSNHMSTNDVDRILYDYRHGTGSYENRNNSVYNYYINSTMSYNYSSTNSSGGNYRDKCNTPYDSNGFFRVGTLFS
jgi:hypothetical protein